MQTDIKSPLSELSDLKRLRVAVIGVGHLGSIQAEKLYSFAEVEALYLIDISEERLKQVSERLRGSVEKPVFVERDYRKVFSEVDAVVVATPTFTHYEIAKEVLIAGKPLFLEKPMTTTYEEAQELVELAEKKGIPFQVGYIERFHRAVRELLNRVRDPLFIEAHRLSSFVERNLDIDVILDLMIHDLDLLFLLKKGEEVEFIHAVGAPVFTDKFDIVNVRIVFKDGTTSNLTASRISQQRQRKFRVFEKGAYYSVDTLEKSFIEIKPNPETRDFTLVKKTFPDDDPMKEELRDFIEGVLEGKKVSPSGQEALVSLKYALRIREEVLRNFTRKLSSL